MPMILVVHGAGMNMRGKVNLETFGPMTLDQYDVAISTFAKDLGATVELFHSNIEGEVINRSYQALDEGVDAAIINPAGYSNGYRHWWRRLRSARSRPSRCTSVTRRRVAGARR